MSKLVTKMEYKTSKDKKQDKRGLDVSLPNILCIKFACILLICSVMILIIIITTSNIPGANVRMYAIHTTDGGIRIRFQTNAGEKSSLFPQDFIDYQQNMGATILCKRQYSLGCFLRHSDHRPKVSTSMASLVSIKLLAVHSKNICAAHKIVTLLWAMMGIHSFITIYL